MSRYKVERTDLGRTTETYSIKLHDVRELATITIAKSSEAVRLIEWLKYAPEQTNMIDGMIRILKGGSINNKEAK